MTIIAACSLRLATEQGSTVAGVSRGFVADAERFVTAWEKTRDATGRAFSSTPTAGDGMYSVVYLHRAVAVPPAASSTFSVRP